MIFVLPSAPVRSRLVLAGSVSLIALASAVSAADVTWTGGTGAWNVGANWGGGAVPLAADNALVDGGVAGDSVVTVTANAAINNLTISTGDSVSVNNAVSFTLNGDLSNDGAFAVNSTGGFTTLVLGGNTAFSGAGVMTLSNNFRNQITGTGLGDVLTNSAGHTITGSGNIGIGVLGLANAGVIEAAGGAGLTLQLNAGATTRENTGTLRAANGGTLAIIQGVIDNTSGVIEADTGGEVSFTGGGTRIDGGTLTGDGAFDLRVSATLADVQNDSDITIANAQTGRIAGTIVNNGTVGLASTGGFTTLTLIGDTTLGGTGVLTLSNRAFNQITGTGLGDVLTNSAGHTIRGSGNIGLGVLALDNFGLIEADGTVALIIDPTGTPSAVRNFGTMRASGAGGLVLTSGEFDNQGLVEAVNGSTVSYTTSGVTLNNDGFGTLTGGQWRAAGLGSTIDIRGGQIATNDAEIILSGAGSRFRAFQGATPVALETSLATNSGALRVLDNRDFVAANGLTSSGVIELGGGTLDAPTLTNSTGGEIFGFGAITPAVSNAGTVRASGGVLTASNGINGVDGTVISQAGATVAIGANSSANVLDLQGGSLALGAHDFTVSGDYTNTAFGVGNAFDRRANVTGSGQIIGENAGLATGGDVVAGVLDLGNVRGGTSVTKSFTVDNTGAGADIRGALQTAAGAGAITDTRLSGSGVTAQNFGPVVAGGGTGAFAVTFDATTGGALTGQTIGVVQNFDNVIDQTIALQGFATQLAQGQAAPAGPVNLGNFRVGIDGPSQSFDVTNLTSGDGAESLGIASASATGNFAGGNDLGAGLIAGGATGMGAASVAVTGGAAGANAGQLTLQYTTDGAAFDATFIAVNANAEVIDVSATGFNVAQASVTPDPVAITNQRVGGTASAALTVANTADAGGFTEGLNASVGGASGDAATNGGSISLLAGGGSDNSSITASVDTAPPGRNPAA